MALPTAEVRNPRIFPHMYSKETTEVPSMIEPPEKTPVGVELVASEKEGDAENQIDLAYVEAGPDNDV